MTDSRSPLTLRAALLGEAPAPQTSADVSVTLPRRLKPGGARDALAGAKPQAVAPDEIARVELDNGFVFFTRADDLLRDRGRKTVSRGDGSELWDIDTAPRTDAGAIGGGSSGGGTGDARGAERGMLGLGIKVLDFFGVDLKQKSAAMIGSAFEVRQLKGATPGKLHRVRHTPEQPLPFTLEVLDTAATPLPADRPLLVFLHGTMSSLGGSFGDLWAPAAPPTNATAGGGDGSNAGAAAREAIALRYGEHVYAFEHRTLSESPIANALALVAQLPDRAQLHLVSHSRGGLVGELLCLGERDKPDDPLQADWLNTLFAADRTVAEQLGLGALDGAAAKERDAAYAGDRERLAELVKLLDTKGIQVRRFVRVACPARGTTLASGRMDRWLSVINLLTGNGLVGDVADFLLAVVKERTDPRGLPGVEAMMPGSALTRLLQHPGLVTNADLSIISGDLEPVGKWGQLKLLAVDWFYGGDHDLVVNTGSMLGGMRRPAGGARFQRDEGGNVTHFNYFGNAKSVRWLIGGLTRADTEDGGFMPITEAKQEEPRWRSAVRASRAATTPRPLALVIPGTMGSALSVKGKSVWLNYWSLLRGGLGDIGWGTSDVQATDLLDDFYGPLLEHLARTHRVEIFAYDWRDSVRVAARQLATRLEALLPEAEHSHQPVHIVAHSMGGLVARSMMADGGAGSAAWRRVTALANSRLLMLGTPNRGSYEAVRWLTGSNATQAKLTLLDITHGTNDIIDIVRRFPGLVELLPFDDASPFGNVAVWKQLRKELGAGWTPVEEATLRSAAATWALLRTAAPDVTRMLYVAGCQPATVVGYQVVDDEAGFIPLNRRKIEYTASREGDGTVPWASGRLDGVPMYYAPDTGHDALCSNTDDARIFRGYVELLTAGVTDQLSTTPPAVSRAASGEAATFVLPAAPVADGIPDEAQLRSLGFSGARPRKPRTGQRPISSTLNVSIRHGDLSYARFPVMVGHYLGDTIVSAEDALDRRLNRALTRRRDLGLYPGRLGTHAVFANERPNQKPEGAVVVGLGQVGELTPSRLEGGVRDALLEHALRIAQLPAPAGTAAGTAAGSAAGAGDHRRVQVSCLLVGTGAGGMPLRDSLEALLRGALAANRKLEEARLDQRVLVSELEFIEVYEDVAINAARDLATVLKNGELAASVRWPQRCLTEGEGRQRRLSFETDKSWWERLEITEEAGDRLRFVATTDRARAEETLAQGQLRLVDAFIAQACASAANNADVAKTLFEMLLPLGLKDATPEQRDRVLLLDDRSARFPWELLEDRWSHSGRPPAVACGMVRQLKTSEFRLAPKHAFDNSVFVVGNPNLNGWSVFPDLPGARREAELVRRLFDQSSYATSACIDDKADAILSGLHSRAWRVLHLAGHGEHEFELPVDPRMPSALRKRVSGMVIGENTFLTPGDVEQMRFVPELVFINCCHLGQTQKAGTADYNKLAANLGVEFIRMGVKAVVACGWAVDDAAAETFAQTFYEELLDGSSFGRAVRAAREATWRNHPGANTWGAYQCYGDQGWRLRRDGATAPPRTPLPYVTAAEWVNDLENMAGSLKVGTPATAEPPAVAAAARAQIAALQARVPEASLAEWLAQADVLAAIGFAHAEAGLFADAVGWLDRSLGAQRCDTPVRAVEQCASLKIRLAAAQWAQALAAAEGGASGQAALAGQRTTVVERIETAIHELNFIKQRAPNLERMALLGSAYKRLAAIHPPGGARQAALLQMTTLYAEALARNAGAASINLYAFGNWAVARLLAARIDPAANDIPPWRDQLADLCKRCEQQARAEDDAEPSLWSAAAVADVRVVQLLACQDAAQWSALADDALACYGSALARGASERARSTLREHLDFVLAMTADWPLALRESLRRVRQGL